MKCPRRSGQEIFRLRGSVWVQFCSALYIKWLAMIPQDKVTLNVCEIVKGNQDKTCEVLIFS